MTRPPLPIEDRKPFSRSEKHAILLRQSTDGIARCEICGDVIAVLSPDGQWMRQLPIEFDHGLALALGGRTHKENGRALCKPCHLEKTRSDVARIAKAERQAGRAGQQARRRARKAAGERPQIQGRGFQKW